MMKKVLVTGAGGFIGQKLCEVLKKNGHFVRGAVRKKDEIQRISADEIIEIGDIGSSPDWSIALKDIDVVIHLAARAHIMKEKLSDPLVEYRRVNVGGAECLAKACVKASAMRIIFLSSIGVNGESTSDKPFTEDDVPVPRTPYAISKLEAENAIARMRKKFGIDIVIIRSPLVYGPHVKGNFLRLLGIVKAGFPLPLGSIENLRSMVSVGNLCDLIVRCIDHHNVSNNVFLVSDRDDLTVKELVNILSKYMGKSNRIFPFNRRLLRTLAIMTGKRGHFRRLCCSLEVDSSKAKRNLDWVPPESARDALKETVSWYCNKIKSKGGKHHKIH